VKSLSLFKRSDGQTMSEYAVILGVITPAIVATILLLSGGIGAALDSVTAIIP
jgi:Flp pilus assembly pilin Flp